MKDQQAFKQFITSGYTFKGGSIVLGAAMLGDDPLQDALVKVPLKTLNRHGLIAGATGTGKTKTIQIIAEQLSLQGIPSVMMDIKGDLSGIAMPGVPNAHTDKRSALIGESYSPKGVPVELMSLSEESGVRLRATVTEFGPVLMSQILGLNDTQGSVLALVFRYCDIRQLPLLDLKDLKSILQHITNEGKEEIQKEFGSVSGASVSTIMRKIIELEQQDAELFFGEPSFDVRDFVRTVDGKGVVSIIRLTDIQSRPKLFSTFMLSLLSEIYETFPEQGDAEKPRLCMFIDEAHLVFATANKSLTEKIETIVKLIRSKGVGVFFCTQTPTDVPESVLGQLGLKVQHALRAFTAKDRTSIKRTAENYPLTEYYDTASVLTTMGIGEAFVTALSEKGIPTPLARTYLRSPLSRMDILSDAEIAQITGTSTLVAKYGHTLDSDSAHEILSRKIAAAETREVEVKRETTATNRTVSRSQKKEPNMIEEISKNTMVRQIGRTIFRELARNFLGSLTGKKR
jgi:DNA helicase HerA-like ATPase